MTVGALLASIDSGVDDELAQIIIQLNMYAVCDYANRPRKKLMYMYMKMQMYFALDRSCAGILYSNCF